MLTVDGSRNLTGKKNLDLLKRMQYKTKEKSLRQVILFFQYIIEQEAVCLTVRNMNHVTGRY
jgi:hypothetical protein